MGEGSHVYSKNVHPRHDTDKGLNRQERYTVRRLEKEIRNLENEKGYIIGSDGKVLAESINGGKSHAEFDPKDLPKAKDAIVIHNHPYAGEDARLYDTMAGRIGVPFSPNDLFIAVMRNAKEVRAATPTYVYSIRRPKGGWQESLKDRKSVMEFFNDMKNYERKFARRSNDYARQQSSVALKEQRRRGRYSDDYMERRAREINDRANVGIQNSMMKELAKKYGFEFTRRMVK